MRPLTLAATIVRNRLGAVPRPAWCTYLVTYRCNARCQMCDSWRLKPGLEMNVAQVTEVFQRVGRLDVVRLTGGEPFLREDLPEIAERIFAASRPVVLHITTNGSFPLRTVELAQHFSRPARLRFLVSLDGLPAEHNANRGARVTFDLAVETVRRLRELRGSHDIAVSVNHTVISSRSLEDHDRLRAIMAKLGVEVHAVLAYADSAMYGAAWQGRRAEHLIGSTGYPLHPGLAEADVVGFVRRQLARTRRGDGVWLRWGKRYYLQGLLARLSTNGVDRGGLDGSRDAGWGPHGRAQGRALRRLSQGPKLHPRCVALRSHLRILPDGSVPVCQFNSEIVGNLRVQSLEAIWRAPIAVKSRAWVDACSGCWAECEVVPSAIYTGDILRPV